MPLTPSLCVADLMRPEPVVVALSLPASEVATIMQETRMRHVFVVDDAGALVGLVNRARLLRHLIARRLTDDQVPDLPVGDLIVRDLVTTHPDAPLAEALCLMRRYGVGSIPVVEHGRLTGLLSERMLLDYAEAVICEGSAPRGEPVGAEHAEPVAAH